MRKSLSLILCAVVGLSGLAISAAEKPSDDYSKAMKALGAASVGIKKAAESEESASDFAAVAKLQTAARDALVVVEQYWKGKAKDAEDIAATAVKATADLGVASSLQSMEGVQQAAKELGATCATCHAAHRERGADNAWMIK